jgi:competence protein ComEC
MLIDNRAIQPYLQPAFYLFLSFSAGILLERTALFQRFTLISLLLIATAIALFSYLRKYNLTASLSILLCFALTGSLLIEIELDQSSRGKIRGLIEREEIHPYEEIELYGELSSPATPAPSRAYLDLNTHLLLGHGRTWPVKSKIRITLWLNDEVALADYRLLALEPGNWLHVEAMAQPVEQFKNPGMSPAGSWLDIQGYDIAVTVKSPSLIHVLDRSQTRHTSSILGRIQEYLFERIDSQLGLKTAGIIKASILGNDHFLDKRIAEDFREGGIYHILVISGSHVGLLALIANTALSFVIKRRWIRFTIVAFLLFFYGLLAGAQMPVMRAVVMAVLGMAALGLERRVQPANTLGMAGIVILAYHPGALFEAGFQLTFIAVGLILLFALPLAKKFESIGSWRPKASTPYPPQCSKVIRWIAELLFWKQSHFEREMADSPIKYRLEKNLWASRIERFRLQKLLRITSVLILTSAIVGFGTLPLSANYFNRIALAGIPLSIAADLLMTALLAVFILFVGADACGHAHGQLAARLVEIVSDLFAACASVFNIQDLLCFRVANYTDRFFSIYLFYYLPVIFFSIWINWWQPLSKPLPVPRKMNFKYYLLISAVVIHILLLIAIISPQLLLKDKKGSKGELEVVFLDVGQGDAAFVRFPGGTTMMIDSGGLIQFRQAGAFDESAFRQDLPSIGEKVVSKYLWWRGLNRIDYLVATHTHTDHIEGFHDVIKNFSSGCLILSGIPTDDEQYDQLTRQARAVGLPLRVWSQGESITIEGVRIETLWPPAQKPTPKQLDNNRSLVLRLSYGSRTILLAGDIEVEAERELAESGIDLSSDVLKSPHHGSRTSSSIEFLKQVRPKFAIISAPRRSRFNHPHLEVIDRYCRSGILTYQTGLTGAITVLTDGEKLSINPLAGKELPCPK